MHVYDDQKARLDSILIGLDKDQRANFLSDGEALARHGITDQEVVENAYNELAA